eukprot:TRINITY_DN277_c0_g1::TRINITY_DN277_c0_g1_i1::g.1667::m.1667 TRINITY_DN277_c0_g1::TRINITY_DN277_c0_g1_i1::g.1667  ORF type:complete len:442 (+),score=28.90,sp/Q9FKM5/XRCC3_ARATH/24.62/6e-25,Rad51/PF08423.6/2.1e-11,Rad51/PF08423.6/9.2e-12,Rad51/PF08423.6/3.5e+02,AAA_25/PF13481.1/8.1e+03,AAA_25/PF13481.1/2.9e-05,AAA_25/PF13481.1/0.037,KaiC/PF06745.8/6.4e-05,KaiC/PF06745.8/9.6,RecA/PF00154.16/3.2,RecA/PF00154.16/1.4,CobU/PF02283.11/2.8e+03,CobU/PF02283.11/0.18,AAA_22/PF13401.1/1.5e+03,AAA_22/PF13401
MDAVANAIDNQTAHGLLIETLDHIRSKYRLPTIEDAKRFRALVAMRQLAEKQSKTLLQLRQEPRRALRLALGHYEIDHLVLDGGFMPGLLTEISGESGAGKTQFCLQLLSRSILSSEAGGLQGAALYISTEGEFAQKVVASPPSSVSSVVLVRLLIKLLELSILLLTLSLFLSFYSRLKQLVQAQYQAHQYQSLLIEHDVDAVINHVMDNIFIEQLRSAESLLDFIRSPRFHQQMKSKNIRLVILDSIAALYRAEFDKGDPMKSRLLLRTASLLKKIGDVYNAVVLVVNQVTDVVSENDSKSTYNGSGKKIPALGLTWSSAVNVRILLEKKKTALIMYDAYEQTPLCKDTPMEHGSKRARIDKDTALRDGYFDPNENPHTRNDSKQCTPTLAPGGQNLPVPSEMKLSSPSARKFILEFSSYLPSRECEYVIDSAGICSPSM